MESKSDGIRDLINKIIYETLKIESVGHVLRELVNTDLEDSEITYGCFSEISKLIFSIEEHLLFIASSIPKESVDQLKHPRRFEAELNEDQTQKVLEFIKNLK